MHHSPHINPNSHQASQASALKSEISDASTKNKPNTILTSEAPHLKSKLSDLNHQITNLESYIQNLKSQTSIADTPTHKSHTSNLMAQHLKSQTTYGHSNIWLLNPQTMGVWCGGWVRGDTANANKHFLMELFSCTQDTRLAEWLHPMRRSPAHQALCAQGGHKADTTQLLLAPVLDQLQLQVEVHLDTPNPPLSNYGFKLMPLAVIQVGRTCWNPKQSNVHGNWLVVISNIRHQLSNLKSIS